MTKQKVPSNGRHLVACNVRADSDPHAETVAAFRYQQILGSGLSDPTRPCGLAVVDGHEAARIGEAVIDLLEEMIAKLFGQRQAQPVRVRADEERPIDKQLKGRK